MKQQSIWLYVRILFILVPSIIQGFRADSQNFPFPWMLSLMLLLLIPIMMIAVTKMNENRFFIDETWYPPQWHRNPFTLRQPFQFFHLIAWQAVVSGVIIGLRFFDLGSQILGQVAVSLSFGISILLGILICTNVFSERMFQSNEGQQEKK